MGDEQKPIYERLEGEPSHWFARYLIYRDIKPIERSLLGACNRYLQQASKSRSKPYKDVSGAWKDAFSKWRWKERAEAYDAAILAEQERNAAILRALEEEEKQRILSEDYALVHKRIQALARMAHIIEGSFIDSETKEITYKYMSPDKLREWRGCLADIALELGHRIKKSENKVEITEFTTEWGGGIAEDDEEEI